MAGQRDRDTGAAIEGALLALAIGGPRQETRIRYAINADGVRTPVEAMEIIRDAPPNLRAIELLLRAYDQRRLEDEHAKLAQGVRVVSFPLPPPNDREGANHER